VSSKSVRECSVVDTTADKSVLTCGPANGKPQDDDDDDKDDDSGGRGSDKGDDDANRTTEDKVLPLLPAGSRPTAAARDDSADDA
jgi:hypothetical protein